MWESDASVRVRCVSDIGRCTLRVHGLEVTRVSALGMSVGRRTLHAARLKVEMHREVTVEALAREGEARGHLREHAAR